MAQAMETSRANGQARAALRERADDVMTDLKELRDDISRLAEAASEAARSEATDATAKLAKTAKKLRKRADARIEDLRGRTENGLTYAAERIRERPGAAIGAALGAGLLIGLLLSPRRH